MVDQIQIENDPSINLNNPEAKATKEIASQFLAKRSGKLLKTQRIREEVEILSRLVDEMESKQGESLMNYVKSLDITEENGYSLFSKLCEETFRTGISWGRITSVHLFAAILSEHLRKTHREHIADKVGLWLGVCIAKHSSWIKNEGLGWEGFVKSLSGRKEVENNVFNGLFNVTIGLSTVAALLFIQAK